ncbi:MAG: HAD-IIB family hydrolase, partial [Oligoflexia bacterium]|nr:HAD-IIB family hydrolase [Oligoflexia bacterium]
ADKFYPYYYGKLSNVNVDERDLQAKAQLLDQLAKFLTKPEKPQILSICRPDKKKNISGLIKAYGEDKELQAMANLTIFAGIRKDISLMRDNEKDVLTEMLLLMDKYDLYGKMAIPKRHDTKYEVPELYRIVAEGRGVFVNIALTEPFGLTLIEASACGLPIVATDDGGPRDIIKNCNNGLNVDPTDNVGISKAIRTIISDENLWKKYSSEGINGVQKHYIWQRHVDKYIAEVKKLNVKPSKVHIVRSSDNPIGERLIRLNRFVFSDIDNTLVGNTKAADRLIKIVQQNREKWGFGVATGRPIPSVMEVLKENGIPVPDVIISSVGSEIYYGGDSFQDRGWASHISYKWDRKKVEQLLSALDFMRLQGTENQRDFNVSYNITPEKDRISQVHELLVNNGLVYNLIYSHSQFLDILPARASKGKAIRYLSYKWEIPLENIVVCGDSGNDEEMLRGNTLAIIVGNYSDELEKLRGGKNVYFSQKKYAEGIIDGLKHYNFIDNN